jgi:hypothetical protein
LVVEDASHKALLRVPLTLSIHNVRMERQSEYVMGFFGLMPPEMVPAERQQAVLQETLTALREHGMNGLSGGPNWRLTGWKNGQPVIDFGQMDSFMELIRRQGFTAPIAGYGGLRFEGVDEGYVVGQTGRKMAQQANLPFDEALMKAWQAVDEHARKANWPTILYSMCDETRVREVAQQEVEYMTAMAKVTKQFPKTVRTIGFYSVNFNNRSQNQDDMLYWHQAIFHALDISSLNGHDQSVVDEAAKTGKEIQLYNQGTSRYSFGPYQWSEYRKGVKARWQWHLNILHGYQFFDLDGREPDTAMICYGRNCIYPTIAFERCREGAEDFYLCQALWNLIEKGAGGDPARQKAKALLEEVASQAKSRQRQAPAGFDADRLKAQLVAAVESLGGQGN